MNTPYLSTVVPIYNESANIAELLRELTATLEAWGRPFEILAVDDGSSDDSFELLAAAQSLDPRIRVIRFTRNFGQTAAFAAGFAHARGEVVVTCDGDLQNDPRDIPALVALIEQGAGMACGWRQDRKDRLISRRLPSIAASWIISWTIGVRLHDFGCSLKAFRSGVAKAMHLYNGMHRLLPALAKEQGATIVERIVNHRPRRFGQSKYGLGRIVPVVIDLLTVKFILKHSLRPIRVFGAWGLAAALAGAATLGWLAYESSVAGGMASVPALILGLLLMIGGVPCIVLSVAADRRARAYMEMGDKPLYEIAEIRETRS